MGIVWLGAKELNHNDDGYDFGHLMYAILSRKSFMKSKHHTLEEGNTCQLKRLEDFHP